MCWLTSVILVLRHQYIIPNIKGRQIISLPLISTCNPASTTLQTGICQQDLLYNVIGFPGSSPATATPILQS
jgi:hypothetical protein